MVSRVMPKKVASGGRFWGRLSYLISFCGRRVRTISILSLSSLSRSPSSVPPKSAPACVSKSRSHTQHPIRHHCCLCNSDFRTNAIEHAV